MAQISGVYSKSSIICHRVDSISGSGSKQGSSSSEKRYGLWTVSELDRRLREETPEISMWLDSSYQFAEETMVQIWQKAWIEAII